MNRRSILTAALSAPAVALAGSLPVVAALETPVMALFREWEAAQAAEDDAHIRNLPDDEIEVFSQQRREIEQRVMAAPCQTGGDFVLKVIACTAFGGFCLPCESEAPAFWAEARALVA